MPSLQVVLGLVLIILFYSLLATIIMELFSSYLGLRGKHLERVLRSMLSPDEKNGELFRQFAENPMYKQLAGHSYGKTNPPSYLRADTFQGILLQLINERKEGNSLLEKINSLPGDKLTYMLKQLLKEVNFDPARFKGQVEKWYNDVMERASGWYQRNIVKILLVLGFAIAVIFNVDILQIYNNLLSASQVDLDKLVSLAQTVSGDEVMREGRVNRELQVLIERNLEGFKDPLGIGWDNMELSWNPIFWVLKMFGWLITALCISKGAPFWFDLLKKMVNFRGAGAAPPPPPATPSAAEVKVEKIGIVDRPVG